MKRLFLCLIALLLCCPVYSIVVKAANNTYDETDDAKISVTSSIAAIVDSNHSLWVWGDSNRKGLLGDGDKSSFSETPIKIADDVAAIYTTISHNAFIKTDGSFWMWGSSYQTMLDEDYYSPKMIMDNVICADISWHCLNAVVKTDGSLWMWGDNLSGGIGIDSTDEYFSTPIKVMDGVKCVSLGTASAAIKKDNSLWMWGYGSFGEIGNGAKEYKNTTPVKVMDDVSKVYVGEYVVAAIKTDGSLWMWGCNSKGLLGNGGGSNDVDGNRGVEPIQTIPVKIMDDVVDVDIGENSVAAIKKDGSLWTWGSNDKGQLATDYSTKMTNIPIKVMENVVSISVGSNVMLAATTDGSVYIWGTNTNSLIPVNKSYTHQPVKIEGIIVSNNLEDSGKIEDEVHGDTDTEHLYLVGSSPAKDEKISDLNSQHEITLEFNQDISVNPKWSAGSIYIKDYTTDETILEIDDKEFYSRNGFISGNKLTIPLALIAFDAGEYYIEIPVGFFAAQNLNGDGKIIKFDGILSKDELRFVIESDTCRLNELTSVDYLAFSDIAYNKDLHADMSVREILSNEWDSHWKSTDIKYYELFEHIANWHVDDIISKQNGFAAVSFINDYNEVVIAFRGSENPTAVLSGLGKYASADFGSLSKTEEDAINDWLKNDLPMELLNQVGEQYFDALDFYDEIANREWIKDVHVTGHSLGGAWGDIVSSYSGCYGETFNAVSALDVVYRNYPEYMAKMFSGIDKQYFIDHVNEYDILAGQFGAALKTRSVHMSNYSKSSIANNHSLESMVTRDANGNVTLTKSSNKRPDKLSWICANYYEIIKGFVMDDFSLDDIGGSYVDFGTNRGDSFYNILSASNELDVLKEIFSGIFNRVSYGGAGDDEIVSSISSDVIIGGTGDDILSGNLAGDLYLYYKGDGTDYIVDQAGNDYLVLCDFNEDDIIHVKSTQDSQYIEVYCNNDVICYIAKECRSAWSAGTFKIRLIKENEIIEQEIGDSYFNPKNYVRRTVISCPVDVEIIDSTGNVACVVSDQIQNLYYGEFGVAVCHETSEGEYEKVIDLAEGYSTRIVGKNNGVMDVCVYTYANDGLSNPYSVKNVAVINQMVSTIQHESDNVTLLIDENNDGNVDKEIALLSDAQDNSDGKDPDTDIPTDDSQENDAEGQEREKRNWILPVGVVLILLCGVVVLVIAAKKGKMVNPNAR